MVIIRKHCFPILILHYLLRGCATQSCYLPNGLAADSDIQPCISDRVNLPAGSHSACCNLGKTPKDFCMTGGLCYRRDAPDGNFMIYAVGCTDPTGKDASCQQYCTGELNALGSGFGRLGQTFTIDSQGGVSECHVLGTPCAKTWTS
jgi:hypothetical protein